MSIFRPSNLNKRLTGTPDRSPGNGGQIGPDKTPYVQKNTLNPTLGERYYAGGSSCGGVFKTNESYCGSVQRCQLFLKDLGGNLICISAGFHWIVAPSSSEVSRTWYLRADANTTAQQVTGCTGWFIPTRDQLISPGYSCRIYWYPVGSSSFWGNTDNTSHGTWTVYFANGRAYNGFKNNVVPVRAFRCITL